MKHFLNTLICIFIPFVLSAQIAVPDNAALGEAMKEASAEHLTFKGVPICGNIDTFEKLLKEKGFTTVLKEDDGRAMKGAFAGKDITLLVLATPLTHTVWKAVACFEEKNSWTSLKSEYLTMRESLREKYGKPDNSYEFFSSPYYEGDGYEMTAVYAEKCHYIAFWENIKSKNPANTNSIGSIAISIDASGTKGQVSISYEDGAGTELAKAERNSVRNEDL